MSTLPTRGSRWTKRYFEIKGRTGRDGILSLFPSPNLSNYILLLVWLYTHENHSSSRRMRVVLPAKYPDKMPLVEISGEPVSWKFSGTSRPDVRVSSSIGPSHRQHRCSLVMLHGNLDLSTRVCIYSAPIPFAFTLAFFLTTAPPKKRSTFSPSIKNAEIKFIEFTIERFTFIFVESYPRSL